jgi:hypothetical protein
VEPPVKPLGGTDQGAKPRWPCPRAAAVDIDVWWLVAGGLGGGPDLRWSPDLQDKSAAWGSGDLCSRVVAIRAPPSRGIDRARDRGLNNLPRATGAGSAAFQGHRTCGDDGVQAGS